MIKQDKVFTAYEKLCGIHQGSADNPHPQNVGGVTQEQIAKELGVDVRTIQNLKKLIEEIIKGRERSKREGKKEKVPPQSEELKEIVL